MSGIPSKSLLTESKRFCILPWVHFHTWPDGKFFPCCIWNSDLPMGNYKESKSLKALWNNPKMKQLRLDMLNDRPSTGCARCYYFEDETKIRSLRQTMNEKLSKHWGQVESTKSDGHVEENKMAYMDIRFSNICNFKCRSCGPELSSGWYEDASPEQIKEKYSKVLNLNENGEFWSEVKPLLSSVEEVYFAGGEPLITKEHYDVLEYWMEIQKFDIQLTYTTNFSRLKWGKYDAIEMWRPFHKVIVNASLDASGARAEYLRSGTRWSVIEKNREELLKRSPEVDFYITPTIGLFNAWHFTDFHRDWVEKGFVEPEKLRMNILTFPYYLRPDGLPRSLALEAQQKCREHKSWLLSRVKSSEEKSRQINSDWDSVIQLLDAPEDKKVRAEFIKETRSLDQKRKENYVDVFPELAALSWWRRNWNKSKKMEVL